MTSNLICDDVELFGFFKFRLHVIECIFLQNDSITIMEQWGEKKS